MSTDERELRRALEDTQAALRAEREAAKELRHTNAALDERLRELKQREGDLERQLAHAQSTLPAPPEPKIVYVQRPAPADPPQVDSPMGWWFFIGSTGLMGVVAGLSMGWDIFNTPPWQTTPSTLLPVRLGIGGLVVLVMSVFFGFRRLGEEDASTAPPWWFFSGLAGTSFAFRAADLVQDHAPLSSIFAFAGPAGVFFIAGLAFAVRALR